MLHNVATSTYESYEAKLEAYNRSKIEDERSTNITVFSGSLEVGLPIPAYRKFPVTSPSPEYFFWKMEIWED